MHRWHVQVMGAGPDLLMLHGAGGSAHSWRAIAPVLAQSHRVILIDLPGHGFTQIGSRARCGLAHMSADITALCAQEGWVPEVIVAHSAGCAIALHMVKFNLLRDVPIIGFNPALAEFDGMAGWLFPAMAKMLAATPFTASLFALSSDPVKRAKRLISGTGSQLDAEGLALYGKLIADRAHVDGALQMMAQWDLSLLLEELPGIAAPCHFVTGARDKAVPPQTAQDAAQRLPNARVTQVAGLGHMAHEEQPEAAARLILDSL